MPAGVEVMLADSQRTRLDHGRGPGRQLPGLLRRRRGRRVQGHPARQARRRPDPGPQGPGAGAQRARRRRRLVGV
ncbi:hypothetical protein G5V59_00230 [Nocardioides sp. W3-2-3]|uniref:hypothetical protein n=1 Tax=Nocardioides convexus TaxID=2712224 RepID=UPI0024183775|nr:hypothetical protein [Nocardioides convexus]NGZ99400.1 hypothetical protein [Nocardioides convexus]